MEGGAQLVTGSAPSGTPGEPPQSTAEDSADTGALVRLAPESGFEERMADTQMVERALRRVPVDYRTALLLHVSLGFTVAEVAEQLGTTPGAVRMRLCRGLAFLRASYREERA